MNRENISAVERGERRAKQRARNAGARRVFSFQQGAAWEPIGYPIFVRRIRNQLETGAHEHVYHEVAFVEAGTAIHRTAAGTQKLRGGDLIIIKPGVWHQYQKPENFQIVNCLFDRKVLRHQQALLSLLDGAFELFCKPPLPSGGSTPVVLHASPAKRARISEILNHISRERKDKSKAWEAAMMIHLLDLMVCIARIQEEPLQQEDESPSEYLRDFVNEVTGYLEQEFREPISMEVLSRKFHISPSHLSRVFSKRMGMGVVNYVHHLRIEEACRLLRFTEWSVSRIAGEVGYDEVSYFARRFRKHVGKTAMEYRNSIAYASPTLAGGEATIRAF